MAVSLASPVIIFTVTPPPCNVLIISLMPSRGASIIPTKPRKTKLPGVALLAKARTKTNINYYYY